AEAEQAHALDVAQFALGEAELLAPGGEDVVADGEAHAGGDEGEEAGPEEDHLAHARASARGADARAGRGGPGGGLVGDLAGSFDVLAHRLLSPLGAIWERDGDSRIRRGGGSQMDRRRNS